MGVVRLRKEDMKDLGVEMDETQDIIDLIMNVETLEAAVLFREDGPDNFQAKLPQ